MDDTAKKSQQRANELKARFESRKQQKYRNRPLPLQREIVPPKPFPFEALGSVLGPVAKRIHEIVKAPDSICGQSVLSAAALITQAHADIHIDGRVHPLSLFTLTAAESGDRKSAVDAIALKAVRDFEKMLKKVFEEEKQFYKNKMDVRKKQRDQLMTRCDLDRLESELNKLASEPQRPLEPYLLLEEPTYEGLVKLYAIGQPSVGLFSDEGGRMLTGHSMGKDHMLKTACGLSNLWDGKPISRIRGGDENLLLYGKRFSTHLMIQEVVLATILKNELLIGQGMIARCLIVSPLTNSGNRPYNETDVSTDPIILDFWNRTRTILDQPFPLFNIDILNELNPRPLSLCPLAKRRWVLFHDELDQALKPDGMYRLIRRTANKGAEQALRIAGILALIEDFDASSISVDVIERSIELIRFYLDEALRIADASSSEPELELAQAVLDWMKRKVVLGESKLFSLQKIYQKGGPRKVRNQKTAKRIMAILEEHQAVERPDQNKLEWRLNDPE